MGKGWLLIELEDRKEHGYIGGKEVEKILGGLTYLEVDIWGYISMPAASMGLALSSKIGLSLLG